jgi:hypothetical protein
MTIRSDSVDPELEPGEGVGGKTQVVRLARNTPTQLPSEFIRDFGRDFSGGFFCSGEAVLVFLYPGDFGGPGVLG